VTNGEAYHLILVNLVAATDAEARDVRDVLRLGAGDAGPPGVPVEPAAMPAERRYVYYALVEGIRHLGCGGADGDEYTPIRAGHWEPVLASLVIDGGWAKIRETADDLRRGIVERAVELLVETRDVCRDTRLWEARTMLERLLWKP